MTETPSFHTLSTRWLQENDGAVSAKTIAHYNWLLDNYILPRFGESTSITEQEVRVWMKEMLAKDYSESTIYTCVRLIQRILDFGKSYGLIKEPSWTIDLETPNMESQVLSEMDAQKLESFLVENPSPKNLGLYLILTTGMAVGEVLQLTWADVSLQKSQIRVLKEDDGKLGSKPTVRKVPIGEKQKIYLKKLTSLPTCYLASAKPKPLKTWPLRMRLVQICEEILLPQISPTGLRHTYAVRAMESGASFNDVAKQLGVLQSRNFRAFYRELVTPETRERLEREQLESQKVRQAPKHVNNIGPDITPEVVELRKKVEAKKKQLNDTLASLEGDMEIIHALRNSDLSGPGAAREGLYSFVEKVLGDDRDGKMLVEYLRNNMRVASMPSLKDVCPQTIRARVSRGFAKLNDRLDAIYAVEGYDILDMFRSLTARIKEVAPTLPQRPGRKPKITLENEYKQAMEALDRIAAKQADMEGLDG